MSRTVYTVLREDDDWFVRRNSGFEISGPFDRKMDAAAEGRRVAKANKPSRLIVHRRDGTVEREFTYGNDSDLARP